MSGGSWDYIYNRVEDVALRLEDYKDPLRNAFGKHLHKVSKALHDMEWVDSGDYSPGEEVEAIRACFDSQTELLSTIENAQEALKYLEDAIKRAKNV